jgi:hypothetical protein
MTLPEQQAIADLRHHAGYLRLLELLADSTRDVLAEAEHERDPDVLLRQIRYWQFLTKVHGWLETAPATIGDELALLREDGLLGPDAPVSRNDAWARRFAHKDVPASI